MSNIDVRFTVNAGTHDVLRILLEAEDPADNRTALIPFVKEMVPSVDLEQRIVTVDPVEGLLDISAPATRKHKPPRDSSKARRL